MVQIAKAIDKISVSAARRALPEAEILDLVVRAFRALGDETRAKLLYALLSRPLCVRDLALIAGVSESAVPISFDFSSKDAWSELRGGLATRSSTTSTTAIWPRYSRRPSSTPTMYCAGDLTTLTRPRKADGDAKEFGFRLRSVCRVS